MGASGINMLAVGLLACRRRGVNFGRKNSMQTGGEMSARSNNFKMPVGQCWSCGSAKSKKIPTRLAHGR